MKKAVIYARYSSDKQTEQSIEGQLRVCNKFAEDNNMTIVANYIDRAVSATTDNRIEFQKMITDSAKKKFDFVIVYKLDRFARNRYDSAINKALLKKNSVKLLSAQENITDAPEGIILESMLEGMAEYYSVELAQKVKRGMFESLQKKMFLGGKCIYGYNIVNGKYVINEDEAQIVHKIFKDYNNGIKTKDIVEKFKIFSFTRIMKMLSNEKYIGIVNYGENRIEDYLPPIVEKELFENVRIRIDKNKRAPARAKAKVNYLLSGKLYCGNCQMTMIGESGKGKHGDIYHYYKCSNRKKNTCNCNKKIIKKDLIENLVIDLTIKHIFNEKIYNNIIDEILRIWKSDNNKIVPALVKQKEIKVKELNNIITAIKKGIFSINLQNELADVETQISNIETQIAIEEAKSNIVLDREKIEFWLEQFKNLDLDCEEARARLIDAFVYKIILYDDKVVIYFNITGRPTRYDEYNISDLESVCSNLKPIGLPNTNNPNLYITPQFIILKYIL